MDLGPLLSGLFIGTIGMGIFVYGKRATHVRALGCGLALMVFPYFVHSTVLMWCIAAACIGALWASVRYCG